METEFSIDKLLPLIGPQPDIGKVADFLGESRETIYRKLRLGELEIIKGYGITRISLPSLVKYLNSSQSYISDSDRPIRNKPSQFKRKREFVP
jgi:hypothetical protein